MARIEVATPAEVLAAEEAFAALVVAALRDVARRSAETLGADTLITAATITETPGPGEPLPPPDQSAAAVEDISIIPALWTVQVTATLMPELSAIYELSGVHILTAIGEAFPDLADIPAVSGFAAAEQRLANAQNRLVGIGDMLWEQARAQLLTGFAAGEDIGQLRDRVQAAAGVTDARAERIARTEVISASNAGSIDQIRAAGLVGTKEWLATPDERTRCTHRKAEGQTVDLGAKFVLGGFGADDEPGCADVGASYGDYPGDPALPAAEAINCRCSMAYDVDVPALTAGTVNGQQLNGQQLEGGVMPWHIVEDSSQCPASRPYAVVKDATGQVEGCHPSRMAASDQLVALYAAEKSMAEQDCPEGEHKMPDGECMMDDEMPSRAPDSYGSAVQRWEGTLAIEGVETGDGRMFNVDALTWRDLPVPLMYQKVTSHGGIDDVTVNVGSIDEIWRDGNLIWARGRLDMEDPNGVEVERKMRMGFIRGVSIDADSIKDADVELVFPGNSHGEDVLADLFASPELTIFNKGRISAATVVNIPAFQEARLFLVDAETGALVAAGAEAPDPHSFAAVRPHDTSTSGDSWDIGANEKRLPSPMPVATGRNFYAWIDDAEVSDGQMPKSAGKFGHHMVSADSTPGAANMMACSAGIGALHGARSMPNIPDADRRAVYDHLAAHMRDADMEPPPFDGETLGFTAADPPTSAEVREAVTAQVAAAYTIEIPDLPRAEDFEEPDELPPIGALWVTKEGRVFGLVGPGDTAHRSFRDRRVTIPMGNVDYSAWMNRPTLVQGGRRVATGVITMNCGHASPLGPLDPGERMKHYDNSCSIAAVVAVGESKKHGAPWVSGVLMPMTAEQAQRFMACQLSGDWAPHREKPGWREFVAALAVPVPGFARATKVRVVEDVLVSSAVPIRSWEEYQTSLTAAAEPEPELVTAAATPALTDEQRLQVAAMRDRLGLSSEIKLRAIASRMHNSRRTRQALAREYKRDRRGRFAEKSSAAILSELDDVMGRLEELKRHLSADERDGLENAMNYLEDVRKTREESSVRTNGVLISKQAGEINLSAEDDLVTVEAGDLTYDFTPAEAEEISSAIDALAHMPVPRGQLDVVGRVDTESGMYGVERYSNDLFSIATINKDGELTEGLDLYDSGEAAEFADLLEELANTASQGAEAGTVIAAAVSAAALTDIQREQLEGVRDGLGLSPKAKLAAISGRVRETVGTAPRPAPVPGTFEGAKQVVPCAPCAAEKQRRAAAAQGRGDRHRADLDQIVTRVRSLQARDGQGPAPPAAAFHLPGQHPQKNHGDGTDEDDEPGIVESIFGVIASAKVKTKGGTYHLASLIDREGRYGNPGGQVLALAGSKVDWGNDDETDETVIVPAAELETFTDALSDLAAKSKVRPPVVDEEIGGVLVDRSSVGGVEMAAYNDWGGDLVNEGEGVVALAYNGPFVIENHPDQIDRIEWPYLLEIGSETERLEASDVGPIVDGLRKLAADSKSSTAAAAQSGDRYRAALAGIASRVALHLPGQHDQRNHGDGDGADVIPGDKLKLAGRIDLKPGEKLVSSQRIRTRADADGWDLMTAEVDTPDGRQVRLGIIHPDDSKRWTAGPDPKRTKRIAELEEEIDRLESEPDLSDTESDRLDELQSERNELLEFDEGNLNRTAFVEPASVKKMRADVDAGIERAKDWSKAWRRLSDEYDDVQSDDDLSGEEKEDRLARIEEQFNALGDNDQEFLAGSIPGGSEGDLHYLVGGIDDGEGGWKIELGIKPPDAEGSWYIGENDDSARFEGSDVKKLLKALGDLSGG